MYSLSCTKNRSGHPDSVTCQPVFPGDARLPENPDKEIHAYFGPVGIRDREDEVTTDHVRMSPAMKRAVKTKYL